MKKKVCVYAIAKNESQFVDRWVESMKEADLIIVGDTGSTDDTVKKLKKLGVKVYNIEVNPWRFDKARNMVLDKIPKDVDICLSVDLDEIATKGWRKQIEEYWKDDTTRLKYNYNWSFDEYGNPAVNFLIEKAHSRTGYKWTHPVHEILEYIGDKTEKIDLAEGFDINHYPDKTKSRGNYLPLLELSVEEDPEDDRNMHYLGREYMYYGKWNECIDTLIRHLNLKRATWRDERSASMRFIARSYIHLNRLEEAKMWYQKAINETPYLREPYVELAQLYYRLEDWANVTLYCKMALEIKTHPKTYINEPFCWNETIYDLLSLSTFYQGNQEEALEWSKQAVERAPENERLQNNYEIIKSSMES